MLVAGLSSSMCSLIPGVHGRAERMPGFSHLRMREVNYFHSSIILHNDTTILIVFNQYIIAQHRRLKSKTITTYPWLSRHCILHLCRLYVRPRLMITRCLCHCKWPLCGKILKQHSYAYSIRERMPK